MTPEVVFDLELQEEHDDPVDSFEDPETLAWVRQEIRRGNPWAWFHAKVIASIEIGDARYEGVDYLGACSYENEKSFKDRAGYWPDMQQEALDDLESLLYRADTSERARGPQGRPTITRPVLRALAEAALNIDLYRRGLRIRGRSPAVQVDRLIDELGVPGFLGDDKMARQVLLDALAERGYLVEDLPIIR